MSLPLAGSVACTALSPTAIRVAWTVPDEVTDHREVIKFSFRVYRRRKGVAEWVLAHQQPDVYRSIVIQDLRPFTEYEVQVETFTPSPNYQKAFPCTTAVCVRTKEGTPGPVRQFHVRSATTESITVSWQPPAAVNGLLKGYRLYFDHESSGEFSEVELPPNESSYTATFLYPATFYRFQVVALTCAGEGPITPILRQQTRLQAVQRFQAQTDSQWRLNTAVINDDRSTAARAIVADKSATNVAAQGPQVQMRTGQLSKRRSFSIIAPSPSKTAQGCDANALAGSRGQDGEPRKEEAARKQRNRPSVVFMRDTEWQVSPAELKAAFESELAKGASRTSSSSNISMEATRTLHRSSSEKKAKALHALRYRRSSQSASPHTLPNVSPHSSPDSSHAPETPSHKLADTSVDTTTATAATDNTVTATTTATSIRQVSIGTHPPSRIDHRSPARQEIRNIRDKQKAVKKTLKRFEEVSKLLSLEDLSRLYDAEVKNNSIVLYITSTSAIRETKSQCDEVKAIFYRLRVKTTVRNISMDKESLLELQKRAPNSTVPQAFIGGLHLGGYDDIVRMNESGDLKERVKACREGAAQECRTCGGEGYILCTWCQGSKHSLRHIFAHNTRDASLNCTACNENALQRCPDC